MALLQVEGISGIVIFAVVYFIVTILGKMKEASRLPPATRESQPQARRPSPRRPPPRPPQMGRPPGDTQSEATRLEELLRALGEAAGVPTTEGPMGRPARVPLPSAEEVEERESLERDPDIQNLEVVVRRAPRQEVDQDDDAEALVQRRIDAAQQRDRSLNRADHLAFDKRIRQVAADHTAVAKPKLPALRKAVIWREILGPPVSLRDRSDLEL